MSGKLNKNSFRYLRYLIYTDLYRLSDQITASFFISSFFNNAGFKYCFWMRVCKFLKNLEFTKIVFYPISKGILRRYTYKFGISIPFTNSIGEGLYIGHFGGIFVSPYVIIGKNCNISQDVTLGHKVRGAGIGSPTIGDNVYIAPGVKIFGNIKIGNNAAIGANCVVTKDVPDNGVVVGIPGKIISYEGSEGYVCFTDYKNFDNF